MTLPINQNDFFGTDRFMDPGDFLRLVTRLSLDLGFVSLVVLLVYYRLYKNREYVFTYFIFNLITFSMCMLLRKVPMELGFALGLFAVFGILRYRTEEIRMRDLTYLFIMIGLGIVNGVANKKVSTAELLMVNTAIVGLTALLELPSAARRYGATPMLYDNLRLLQPQHRAELIADIQARTGLDVMRVQVHRIDMLRDAAEITIFYRGASSRPEESKRDAA
ncbi:MAG: DUF4956 domain-containing protein [Kofleriaceae bacterium]|nr:MAG: DUF4956 domain-containing protein [Kofleriaceae bacterium]MBZ0236748.1 DUF4956 domain-containing protein [Kofleriaceae bacterium]